MSEGIAAAGEHMGARSSPAVLALAWAAVLLGLFRQEIAIAEAHEEWASEVSKLAKEVAKFRARGKALAATVEKLKVELPGQTAPVPYDFRQRAFRGIDRERLDLFLERAPRRRGKVGKAGSRAVFDYITAYYGGPPGYREQSLKLQGLPDAELRAAREALLTCLGHPDPRVRQAGLEGFGTTCRYDLPGGWRKIRGHLIPAVMAALRDPDAGVRGYAARVLGYTPWPPARDALVEAIRSESEDIVLTELLYAFGGYARAEDAGLLLGKILDDGLDPQGRVRALNVLAELPAGVDPGVAWPLVYPRKEEWLRRAAGCAVAQLGRRRDFEKWLELYYGATDDRDRSCILEMLVGPWLFEPEVLGLLESVLLDPDCVWTVRNQAAEKIGRIYGPAGVEKLLLVAQDTTAPEYLRTVCLQIAAREKRSDEALDLARLAPLGPADHPFVAALPHIFSRRRDIGISESLPALIARMKPGNQRNVLDGLMQDAGGPAAVRYYLEQYRAGRARSNDGNAPGRDGILRKLADWNVPEAIGLAREVLKDAGSPGDLRRAAMYAAARMGLWESAELIEAETRPGRPVHERRYAIWALSFADPDRAAALMPKLLGDPVLGVRDIALRMCYHLKRPELADALAESLAREPALLTRVLAAAALAAAGGDRGKEYLVQTLRTQAGWLPDGLIGLRYIAWWAHEAAPEKTKPVLTEMLSSKSRAVSQLAASYLFRYPGDREKQMAMLPLLWNRHGWIDLPDEHRVFLADVFDQLKGPDRARAVEILSWHLVANCRDSAAYRKAIAEARAIEKRNEPERLPEEPFDY